MAKVVITTQLQSEILRTFKAASEQIFLRMKALESSPHTGKTLGHVGEIVIKELKYEKYRFYFIADGRVLKFGTEHELAALLIRFVRFSDKNGQQKVIDEIKGILRSMGFEAL